MATRRQRKIGPHCFGRLPIEVHPLGNGLSLVHCRASQTIAEVPSWIAQALEHLDGFDSLPSMIRKLESLPSARGREELRPMVERLSKTDLFVSDTELLGRLRASRPPRARAPLGTMGMLTRDRPELLLSNLESFIAEHAAYGHRLEYLVVDDSPKAVARRSLRARLARLARRAGVVIRYAGFDEKDAYARALSRASDVPLPLARFALFGRPGCGTTAGANRNALLFHDVDAPILMADDDIGCRHVPHPQRGVGLRVANGVARETWFYPNRSELHRAHPFEAVDSFALHQALLMRSAGELVAGKPSQSPDLTGLGPVMLEALLSRSPEVVATATGVVGDSGLVDDPLFLPSWFVGQLSRGEATNAGYTGSRRSRLVCLVPRQTTLASGSMAWMSGCAAYAPARDLPPFSPVGRGQDGLFAIMTRMCRPDALFAFLPWAIDHRPPGMRRAGASGRRIRMDLAGVLFNVLSWRRGPRFPSGGAVPALGRWLTDASSVDFDEFNSLLQASFIGGLARTSSACEAILIRRDLRLPGALREDVERYRKALARAVLRSPEVGELALAAEGSATLVVAHDLVRSLGALLQAWPALLAAAASLTARETRLFREL
jgi:hypothetical protein